MEEENKNKRKVHITPEMLKEFKEDCEKHAIMVEEEVKQEAERDAILFGDSYITRMDRESYLKALLGPMYDDPSQMEWKELTNRQIALLKAPCVDEKAHCFDDLVEFGTIIHRDDVDDNLPEPETDIVTVIQSVDYDKLKKIIDIRRHFHYYEDYRLYRYFEEEEERNNDSFIGKIHYSGSASDCIRMLSARYNKVNSAYRCRKRHRK